MKQLFTVVLTLVFRILSHWKKHENGILMSVPPGQNQKFEIKLTPDLLKLEPFEPEQGNSSYSDIIIRIVRINNLKPLNL